MTNHNTGAYCYHRTLQMTLCAMLLQPIESVVTQMRGVINEEWLSISVLAIEKIENAIEFDVGSERVESKGRLRLRCVRPPMPKRSRLSNPPRPSDRVPDLRGRPRPMCRRPSEGCKPKNRTVVIHCALMSSAKTRMMFGRFAAYPWEHHPANATMEKKTIRFMAAFHLATMECER